MTTKRIKNDPPPYADGKGGLEFTLIPEKREIPIPDPSVPADYNGYYQGHVQIVSAPHSPNLVGLCVMLICKDRLPFCAPYHVYFCPSGILLDERALLSGSVRERMVIKKGAPSCRVTRYKSQWSRSDMEYALLEAAVQFSVPTIMYPLAQNRMSALKFPLPLERVLSFEWLSHHTLIGKGPGLSSPVFDAFQSEQWDQKNRRRIAALTMAQVKDLASTLKNEPWELVWKIVMHKRFGKLRPLTYERYRQQMGRRQEPEHVMYALRILWKMREQQTGKGGTQDTLFGTAQLGVIFPCLPREQRAVLEERVYAYCAERDVVRIVENGSFAFKEDLQDAQSIIRSLGAIKRFAEEKKEVPLTLRPEGVPIKPPRLTVDQRAIAQHITQHWLTIVLGSPGTGKTAVITWLLSHYGRALAVGFVGMLVKMLQRRNGRRPELAYTIDYLIYCSEQMPIHTAKWLAQFEVLVIDECSNVSMGRLRKLLPLFKQLRKIVFVGDTHQLKSLKPGDTLGDLAVCFPAHSFRLSQNLRVAPELKTLQDVPTHIVGGGWRSIGWGPAAWEAPVGCVNPEAGSGPAAMMSALFAKLWLVDRESASHLLNIQILTLTHQGPYGRVALNHAAQEAFESLGVLQRKPPFFELYKDFVVYAGCKITFKRNYNHPIEKEFGTKLVIKSDPIANGELVIIRRIYHVQRPGRGVMMEVSDSTTSEDTTCKKVWIDAGEGVDPFDIECGNATTVYKSQGREFPYVIFCVPPQAGTHWTRANAYVAASRAQRGLVIMGPRPEFEAICARPNVERRTVFSHLLAQESSLTEHVPLTGVETIVDDPETLSILHKTQLAVPILVNP